MPDYAEANGYEVAGEWYDEGDNALLPNRREQFAALLDELNQARVLRGREVLVLLFDWQRLGHQAEDRPRFARRVVAYGGRVETIAGARTDRPQRGQLTQCPTV